jgi:predicted transcriptional regulator of viral defense system
MRTKPLRRSERRTDDEPTHGPLADLAKRQHGVVSIDQLLGGLGYSRTAVVRGSAEARLHRIHRGVYAVGHTGLSLRGQCLAAVLACGPGGLLSHYSAAWLWGLAQWSPVPIHSPRRSPAVADRR